MNLAIDLIHCSLCGSVVEHQSAESEGLRFSSSIGDSEFFLFPRTHDKTNILLYLLTELKNYHFSYITYLIVNSPF